MKIKNTLRVTLTLATLLMAHHTQAQRVSNIGEQQPQPQVGGAPVISPVAAPAPQTVKAKYEGGIIGYAKSDGTLTFDDDNQRLLFRDKKQKEVASLPYSAINAAYADTKSKRPLAATIAESALPYGLGLATRLIKKKYRYLTLHYRDSDSQAEGLTSFKLETKEMLGSVLVTLGKKAGLTQRGEAFVRRREPATAQQVSEPITPPVPATPPGRP